MNDSQVQQSAVRRSNRGFASMDRGKQKLIASKGGKASQASGRGHRWDTEEAREAGRKGGAKTSKDREHMSTMGKRSAEIRTANRRRRTPSTTTPTASPEDLKRDLKGTEFTFNNV